MNTRSNTNFFDDGDNGHFDLSEEDREGRLRWTEPEQERGAGKVKPEKRRAASSLDDERSDDKKKSRTDKEAMQDSTDEDEEVWQKVGKYDSFEDGDSDEAASNGFNEFKMLDANMKSWIQHLSLQNRYGSKEAGLDMIDEHNYTPPESFEQVFHLADYLFPGKDYHHRLFQKLNEKSRPGIKVRQALRGIKKRNPYDPLVSWHEPREEWIPPNKIVLAGMIDIIRKK